MNAVKENIDIFIGGLNVFLTIPAGPDIPYIQALFTHSRLPVSSSTGTQRDLSPGRIYFSKQNSTRCCAVMVRNGG